MHFQDSRSGMPLCWQGVDKRVAFIATTNIDNVTCTDCLRPLAKDAVLYGRGRRARRQR